jgi:hypothetical protein
LNGITAIDGSASFGRDIRRQSGVRVDWSVSWTRAYGVDANTAIRKLDRGALYECAKRDLRSRISDGSFPPHEGTTGAIAFTVMEAPSFNNGIAF